MLVSARSARSWGGAGRSYVKDATATGEGAAPDPVRPEPQADCYAGTWVRSASADSWTHGSSELRVRRLTTGTESGSLRRGTFAVDASRL